MSDSPSPPTPENSPTSPPYSPTPSTRESDESQTTETNRPPADAANNNPLRYTVASHSVRITKFGYAIDPVELGYPEIINNLSASARKTSNISFDSSQVGSIIVRLIQGFWSQPAFPKGKQVEVSQDSTMDSILAEFSRRPLFPHTSTIGSPFMCFPEPDVRVRRNRKVSKKLSPGSPATSRVLTSSSPPTLAEQSRDATMGFKTVSSVETNDSPLKHTESPSVKAYKKKNPNEPSSLFSVFGKKASTSSSSFRSSRPPNTYHSWIPRDKDKLVKLISTLCTRMERLFTKEARVLNVPSPCVVLGDIHGNLSDLRNYERSLWPRAPTCVASSYLFLGDYVDRGDHSLECILYLFAMKLIAPKKFFLLRGNHEIAAIQRQYTFGKECDAKFGNILGHFLWKSFNKVFNVMPLAAVIDNQIFCAHGGIPRTVSDIKSLANDIPTPLDNPEVQSPAAWEILWNDPITDSELIGMIEMDNAVVTQTQTTQTVPAENGKGLVTETTSSTAITTDAPAADTGSNAQPDTKATRSTMALNEADSILSREPSVALTYYMRPTEGATEKGANSTTTKKAKQDDDLTLRRMPSDTSSITSTTPQQIMNDGFIANIKRGTAYLFSDQAINHFLKVNHFSHVIRAHEVIPTGFAFHGDGRVITIFSSSKYCGLNNQVACALVDQDKIRIMRLDSGEAGE